MKRNVLLLAFIVAAMAAFSQNPPYQGVAPEDITDGDYYLYNVETGLGLGDNHTNEERYTSRQSLEHAVWISHLQAWTEATV